MDEATELCFWFPAVGRKKVTAAFDGGRIASDGGVMLLSEADAQLGLCETLAGALVDNRDQGRVAHSLASIVQSRVFAIACGYEDGNDLNALRSIRRSSWLAGACRKQASTFVRSRPSPGSKTRPRSRS